ncbi:DUF3137 domain-containing protein [Phytoactinopolyspora mesophila]|uniref:DUF3137 domain-containing protein n=1 Tax=Phytoactinopolyspora mesophila TaxID=2650750 RepID=A0A7K3LX46_9ACTN|nr:DUF3137 domain-containing protein [Phytoactinopolyspora mesophila]NDL55586.1 hypothetical protein [Phytoactinopolyspora mesophila]
MESTIILIAAGGAVVIAVAIALTYRAGKKRTEALQALAASHGWEWIGRDDSLATRWDGPPFRGHPRRSRGRNAVAGSHQGRDFVAFEYSYTTTTSTGQTTSTTTHHYSVWVIDLPAAVPSISLGAEGALGGKVARAFGFAGLEIGDPEFDRRYKVKCDDADFGRRVLHHAMVHELMSTDVWAWRFEGDAMISYRKGRLQAGSVVPRLDAMCAVLDRVPPELWDRYGHRH